MESTDYILVVELITGVQWLEVGWLDINCYENWVTDTFREWLGQFYSKLLNIGDFKYNIVDLPRVSLFPGFIVSGLDVLCLCNISKVDDEYKVLHFQGAMFSEMSLQFTQGFESWEHRTWETSYPGNMEPLIHRTSETLNPGNNFCSHGQPQDTQFSIPYIYCT